ncbi:MAG: hypothetical protein AAGD35_01095 [Actinomycetota bacterium]
MFGLFATRTFTLHTAAPTRLLVDRVGGRLVRPVDALPAKPGEHYYLGASTDDGFRVRHYRERLPTPRDPSTTDAGPLVEGRFRPTGDGTAIDVTVSFRPQRLVAHIVLVAGVAFAGLAALAAAASANGAEGAARAAVAATTVAMVTVIMFGLLRLTDARSSADVEHDLRAVFDDDPATT